MQNRGWLKRQNTRGFTIVELMIALSVLAVLLVLCTLVLMNLGNTYVKGTNQAAAQNTARNIINDITNQIQFGGATPTIAGDAGTNHGTVCIGTTRYSYIIGQQVSTNPDTGVNSRQTRHALWRDTMKGGGDCPSLFGEMQQATPGYSPSQPNSDQAPGTELIPENMRLTDFKIEPMAASATSGLYQVSIGIAYGDNDLLCLGGAGLGGGSDCDTSEIASHPREHIVNVEKGGPQIGCVSGVGDQFCGISELSVTVARRLSSE